MNTDFYRNKNILITGGIGFIGSNLARRLVEIGANVSIIDSLIPEYGGNIFNILDIKDRIEYHISDVRDPYAMEFHIKNKDYLFNLAGQTSHIDSMIDPHTDMNINAVAQLYTLEACRKYNQNLKIIFAGTRQIYGKPDYLPVDELHPIRPVDINGINKFSGEWHHILYNNVYGIRACVLRLTNTYGPAMRVKDARQTFLGIWVRLLLEGKSIQVFGDGEQLRDFNYVDDCVDALLMAGASDIANGKIYNLGSEEVVSLKELASIMVNLGYGGHYELVPFPSDRKSIDIGDYYSNFNLISEELGWKPKISLKDGLYKTLGYYAANKNNYWNDKL